MSSKRVGVVRFLGTNCDRDVFKAIGEMGHHPEWLWFQDQFSESNFDAVVLPGGFSYGDYLRSGALAARMPVMDSVSRYIKKGKPVLGICNGFQILCDAGLLPGALVKNIGLRFVDKWVSLKAVAKNPYWLAEEKSSLKVPVAHGDGRYYLEDDQLKRLYDNDQVWLKYEETPNGSIDSIAGVTNKDKNVAGLMPHPERAMHEWMGSASGRLFFAQL